MIVVVIHAEYVGDAALPVGPPRAGVQALCSRSSCERRKWIHYMVRASRPVQPKINMVLRPPPTASSPTSAFARDNERTNSGTAACPEIVDQPEDHRIGTARRGRHIVKILPGRRRGDVWHDVWQRKAVQKRRRGRTDATGRDGVCHSPRLADRWINRRTYIRNKNFNRFAVIVGRCEKIAGAFILCRYRRERIVRRTPARPVPSAEKEPFISAVKYFGDVQWPADVHAEAGLVVIRLR